MSETASVPPAESERVQSAPAPPREQVRPAELELLNGSGYFKICVPLHNAALEGNWEAAEKVIKIHSQTILGKAIAKGGSTILHVAAGARKRKFVEKLLNSVKPNNDLISNLLLQGDEKGYNAFCFAAATGDVEIAKLMLEKKPGLQNVRSRGEESTPLYVAVLFGNKDMANYLYPLTVDNLRPSELEGLFIQSIDTDLYGIGLKLLSHWEKHSMIQAIWERQAKGQNRNEDGIGETALHKLAHKRNLKTDDALTLVERLWKSLIYSQTSEQVKHLIWHRRNMLFGAAKLGNFEFIDVAVRFYPDLIYEFDENMHSIFHLAVHHRHVDIFDLINKMGFHKDLLCTYEDDDGTNILHLAAEYPNPPPDKIVPGAALELQREILLFEEVERICPPSYRDQKNNIRQRTEGNSSGATEDGRTTKSHTPKELFTETHKDLRERGEKWMKDTASSSMLVATLIATVVFAAAFTVPGGNNQETAKPILLHKSFFKVFAASDAIAFFSSSVSILMFLSILTSRYEEKDFRMQLPLKLMIGLLTLFISVIAMTLAFSSAIVLLYSQNGITVLSIALILLTANLYLVLHFTLLKDVIRSTFCFRHSTCFSRNQIKTKCLPV